MAYTSAQKLNRRIRIERRSGAQDAAGQPLDEWVFVCRAWASILMQKGMGFVSQEAQAGGTEVSRTIGSFRIRRRDGIDAGMRVLHKGVPYDIRVVLPDLQDNRFVDLGVAAGANKGG